MAVYSSVAFCINSFVVIKTTMGPSLRFLMYYSERCSIKQRNIQYGQQYHSPGGVASNIKIFNRVHHIRQFGSNNIFIHLHIAGIAKIAMGGLGWEKNKQNGLYPFPMVHYGMIWYTMVWYGMPLYGWLHIPFLWPLPSIWLLYKESHNEKPKIHLICFGN